MSQLLTALFGKSSGITKLDIEEKILNKERESLNLEFKQISKVNSEINENCITKPILGFLNTIEGNGLLILGIESKAGLAVSIKPINGGIIKDEEQLRSIIASTISSIPRYKQFPKLTFYKTQVNGGNVFFVEIERVDDNCVYYSKITDYSYIRNNDETRRLRLDETLDLIARKNFPQIFVKLEVSKKSSKEFLYDMAFTNEGLEPGRYVMAMIGLFYNDGSNASLEGKGLDDIANLNLGRTIAKKLYQTTTAYPPDSLLLYPEGLTHFGKLKIIPAQNGYFHIEVHVQIQEEKGVTEQKIVLSNILEGYITGKQTLRKFTPYLTLR